jgi:heme-degrading monooxygenase HmoA
MIISFTRFSLPRSIDLDELRAGFYAAAPLFEEIPGLIRKHFLIAEDGRSAGGVYVWEDREAASAFLTKVLAPMIFEKFGVVPTIEYFESPLMVECAVPA